MKIEHPKAIVLKTTIPAAKDAVILHEDDLLRVTSQPIPARGSLEVSLTSVISPRRAGRLANRGFYLDPYHSWVIVQDDEGATVLIPLRKDKA